MNGINGIGGGMAAGWPKPPAGGQGPEAPGQGADFGRMLRTYIDGVDEKQQMSAQAVRDLLAGRTDDLVPAVTEMAKADLSFKLLVNVRNKVIEAYKTTMNMQV